MITLTIYNSGIINWIFKYCSISNQYHNKYGPAVIEPSTTDLKNFKSVAYYIYGEPHRVGGPAYVNNAGTITWICNGKYHRVDGPAIELANGKKFWYINGDEYTYLEFLLILESNR